MDIEASILVSEQNNNRMILKQEEEDEKNAVNPSENEYMDVSKRDFNEVHINNAEKLVACEGNFDIQVLSIISIVTEYNAKNDEEGFEMIKAILAKTDREDLKERMRIIENAFMTCKQQGEMEIVLLTSMLLKEMLVMVACHWQATGTAEAKSSRRTKSNQEKLGSGRPGI